MNPSGRWRISNWAAPTRSKATLPKAAPRTKISSHSGKTPIRIFQSLSKPRQSTRRCTSSVTGLEYWHLYQVHWTTSASQMEVIPKRRSGKFLLSSGLQRFVANKFQPGGFRRIRKLTHDPDSRHVSRSRFAAAFPGSAQRKPCGHGGELFVLRPRRAKWAPQFGDAAHDLSRLESEGSPGAVQEFSFFDSEIAEAATGAGMEKSFAEEFAVRGVYQRMRGKNLVQCGKRSTRGKQQSASREFHSL